MLLAQDATTQILSNPAIQWGFAGFCLILLGIVVWMVKNLQIAYGENRKLLAETVKVIADNTQAIKAVDQGQSDSKNVLIELKTELLRRPCLRDAGGK